MWAESVSTFDFTAQIFTVTGQLGPALLFYGRESKRSSAAPWGAGATPGEGRARVHLPAWNLSLALSSEYQNLGRI